MKRKILCGTLAALTLAAATSATALAAEPETIAPYSWGQRDTAAYGYQAGKVGRDPAEEIPYAGMNYEGGEQGDTSAYGWRTGKAGRESADAAQSGDTANYSFRQGRVGKPWNTEE